MSYQPRFFKMPPKSADVSAQQAQSTTTESSSTGLPSMTGWENPLQSNSVAKLYRLRHQGNSLRDKAYRCLLGDNLNLEDILQNIETLSNGDNTLKMRLMKEVMAVLEYKALLNPSAQGMAAKLSHHLSNQSTAARHTPNWPPKPRLGRPA